MSKRATRKRPRPAPMYLIARGPRPQTIGHVHDDKALDWKLTIAPLGSPPTEVPTRPARIQREVREWLVFDSQSLREANSKGEPLTPFPPKAPPGPPKKWLASTGPGARFEALGRRPGVEKIAALERDQEMKDWYLNEVYREIASFHVPPVFYPPEPLPDGTTLFRAPLKPRPPAMLAAVLRSISEWKSDLRAVLKETGAPIDRVPVDGGRTVDYTLTKWGLDNIRQAPRFRRDVEILRREKGLARDSQARASKRGIQEAEDYRKWKLQLSRLVKAAGVRLGERRGATPGVKGIKRNRKSGPPIGPEVKRLLASMEDLPEDILEGAGVARTWGHLRSVGHFSRKTLARIQLVLKKNPELKTADLPRLKREAERLRSKQAREDSKGRILALNPGLLIVPR